jgi:hypothetical protein
MKEYKKNFEFLEKATLNEIKELYEKFFKEKGFKTSKCEYSAFLISEKYMLMLYNCGEFIYCKNKLEKIISSN